MASWSLIRLIEYTYRHSLFAKNPNTCLRCKSRERFQSSNEYTSGNNLYSSKKNCLICALRMASMSLVSLVPTCEVSKLLIVI